EGRGAPGGERKGESPTRGDRKAKNREEIWKENKLRDLRIRMLQGNRNSIKGCRNGKEPEGQEKKEEEREKGRKEGGEREG
ncbi:hypothetical protein, partial [Brachyspira hyodysenteriae]|uniref:hypothetical protein n=1 Tax=Brachyspira hyodysenteriae TaxID=159 RepID=UPI0015C44549